MKRLLLTLFLCLVATQSVNANVITKGVREIAEAIVKKGEKDAIRELAEFGGKQAIQESLEKAAREGGEELVEKIIQYGRKFGLPAIKTIDNAPVLFIKALEGIPEPMVERAIWAAQREPAMITRLLSQYGSDALQIAARYRGVGTDIVAKLGDDGVHMARNLSENQAIILARHADEIADLTATQKNQVVEAILAAPGRVIDYLEKHPKVFLTTVGVTTLVALKDDAFGKDETITINSDGSTTTIKRGFVERLLDRFQKPLFTVLFLLAAIVACWGAVKIWGCYRRERVRVALAEKTIGDASQNPEKPKFGK
jgi:hypothetical protein